MAYPYPKLIDEYNEPMCILPRHVDDINNFEMCHTMVEQCRDASNRKEYGTGNPKYTAFSSLFDNFANSDAAKTRNSATVEGVQPTTFQYYGGCGLLRNRELAANFWPVAKERLKDELVRYHSNQMSTFTPGAPIIACEMDAGTITCPNLAPEPQRIQLSRDLKK